MDTELRAVVEVKVYDGQDKLVDSATFELETTNTKLEEANGAHRENVSLAEWVETTIMSNAEYESII